MVQFVIPIRHFKYSAENIQSSALIYILSLAEISQLTGSVLESFNASQLHSAGNTRTFVYLYLRRYFATEQTIVK